MNKARDRRAVLRAGLALGASLLVPPVRACEFFSSTMRITHPWTRATGPDPFAVLYMKFDEVTATDRLIGVETPVAEDAEMILEGARVPVNFLIPAGIETLLSEQGTHIRLISLKHPLLVGRAYPLTLTFEKGGTLLTQLSVDYDRSLIRFE